MSTTSTLTNEQLVARIAELEAKLEAKGKKAPKAEKYKITEKGSVSHYCLGHFPVTLTYAQWNVILDGAAELKSFLEKAKSEGKLFIRDKKANPFVFVPREEREAAAK